MSSVQACTGCGGLFPFLPRGICADCIDLREEQFHTVREWLRDNGGASVMAACQATGIEERIIAEFIREGRLEVAGQGSPSVEEQREQDALRARIASQLAASANAAATTPAGSSAPRRGMRTRVS